MIWAAYHAAVVSILVGGTELDEVLVTKEHKLGSPSIDELPGGMAQGE